MSCWLRWKLVVVSTLLLMTVFAAAGVSAAGASDGSGPSFYDFSAVDIHGETMEMADLKEYPVILIVNVASKCGYTQQNYVELQKLYEKYHDDGLMILAFPCNQFGGQEPGEATEILDFAQKTYSVRFPLLAKVDVNGENAHPLFKYLKSSLAGFITDDIKWNFSKFLVVNGVPTKRYATTTSPLQIEDEIVKALQAAKKAKEEELEEEQHNEL